MTGKLPRYRRYILLKLWKVAVVLSAATPGHSRLEYTLLYASGQGETPYRPSMSVSLIGLLLLYSQKYKNPVW